MSFVDVSETGDIQDEEELIEAVEQLVETAAVSLWTDLTNDLTDMWNRICLFLHTLFPFWAAWRKDEALFWSDLEHMCIFGALFLITFWILEPSPRRHRRRRRRAFSWSFRRRSKSLETLDSASCSQIPNGHATSPSTVASAPLPKANDLVAHVGQQSSGSNMRRAKSSFLFRTCSSPISGDDTNMKNINANQGKPAPFCRDAFFPKEYHPEEEETEEELFAETWKLLFDSGYRRLVLPPECKLVEKPRNRKDGNNDNNNNSNKSTEKSTSKKEDEKEQSKAKKDPYDDEEHPVHRLVNYTRQFFSLVVYLLKYDYVAACWTLIQWITICLRMRRHHRGEGSPDEDDDDDDDASQTIHSSSSHVENVSGVQESSSSSKNNNNNSTTTIQKNMIVITNDDNNNIGNASLDDPSGAHSSTSTSFSTTATAATTTTTTSTTTISSTTSAPVASASASADAIGCSSHQSDRGGEEKKDCLSDNIDTPPNTPSALQRNVTDYATPMQHEIGEPDLDNRLPSVPQMPSLKLQRKSSIPKQKDALQNYRSTSVSRVVPNLLSKSSPSEAMSPSATTKRRDSTDSKNFFETLHSQESLKKLNVEMPVPDRNGYIVGDDFLPDTTFTPLLVFVNSRSGPQQGHLLITQLRRLLNPIQVWDLATGGPETILESFCVFTRLRILVCGGDGTVSWIVSAIEKMKLERWPPIAILPLGTGNDLARIHGWGGGYNNESLIGILEQIAESYISLLDRWEMTVENKKGKVKKVSDFFNYLGVGADAQAALQVHMLRESRPQLFFSRVVNKAWYGLFGAEDIIKATSINLPYDITLIADGVEVPLPADSQGIILLNIDSYAGGVPLWSHGTKSTSPFTSSSSLRRQTSGGGTERVRRSRSMGEINGLRHAMTNTAMDRVDSVEDLSLLASLSEEQKYARVTACDKPSSCQDGYLDIVSIRGAFHLGQIRVGLSNAQKLCQCREATIIIKRKVSVQIDGEPWRQNVCTLRIRRKQEPAMMLHRPADDSNGVETEMAKLLDWAEERHLIDGRVHAALMKEFSRRIESKTRQRRFRSQDNIMESLKRAIGSSGNFQQQQYHHHHQPMHNVMF